MITIGTRYSSSLLLKKAQTCRERPRTFPARWTSFFWFTVWLPLCRRQPMCDSSSTPAAAFQRPHYSLYSKLMSFPIQNESPANLWPQIPPERFQETMTAFGKYPGRVYDLLLYAIDNEIHHRGQGYVYLRALGIEPPPFYVRE